MRRDDYEKWMETLRRGNLPQEEIEIEPDEVEFQADNDCCEQARNQLLEWITTKYLKREKTQEGFIEIVENESCDRIKEEFTALQRVNSDKDLLTILDEWRECEKQGSEHWTYYERRRDNPFFPLGEKEFEWETGEE